jgi:elongation factor Ts
MAEITAAMVNELRMKTGAGLMDCKKALTESNGDFEGAIDYLRKKGQKVAELKAGRDAKEGIVIAKTTSDHQTGIVIHLSSETDFVSKNENFRQFAESIADHALQTSPSSLDELLASSMNGHSVQDKLMEVVGKIGENISLKRYDKVSGDTVIAYNHMGGKIGVLVSLNKAPNSKVESIGRDVAMQVAAMSPVGVDRNDVDPTIVQRELEIAREQIRAEGKPENMVDKIATGKLEKFYKENTLLNQPFVKDNSKTIKQVLSETESGLTVNAFKRISLG